MSSPSSSANRVALVTGCSAGGMGYYFCVHLRKKGYRVFATARRLSAIQELEKEGCDLLELDVTDEKSLAHACETVTSATGGRLHLLVNNAGRGLVSPIMSASLRDIRSMMDTNYLGLIACTQTFGPLLIRTASSEHASGSTWRPKVVNVGSVAGIQPVPCSGLYSSSKGAVHRLSDALRLELKGFGVDVVVIAPGVIKTGFAGNVASYGESTKDNNKELEEELYPNLPAILEKRKQLLYGGYRSEADEWAAEQVEVMTRGSAPAYYISGAKSWIAAYAVPYLPTWLIDFFYGAWERLRHGALPAEADLSGASKMALGPKTEQHETASK